VNGVDILRCVGFPLGQRESSFRRLMLVEVVEDDGAVVAARAHGLVTEISESDGSGPESDGFFEQIAEEGDLGGAGAVENAAVRPPENVVGVEVGFAVTAIAALHGRHPKAARHGVAGEISPGRCDIAFVPALVEDHRFAPVIAPVRAQI